MFAGEGANMKYTHRMISSRFRAASMLFLATVSVCFLCSCRTNQTSNTASNLGSTDLSYTDHHVSGTLCDGVTVDADIPDLSNVVSYDIVSARLQLPNQKVIQSMKDYVFRNVPTSEIKCQELDEELTEYTTSDEISLGICKSPDKPYIVFTNRKQYPNILPHITHAIPLEQQSKKFALEKENLAFMSQAEAVQTVEKLLTNWDIHPIDTPQVFCIDGATWYAQLDDPVPTNSPQDLDCYYMIFQTGYNNIPYTWFEYNISSIDAPASILEVFFSKDGIVQFNYSYANYTIESTLQSSTSAITLDQALSQIRNYYNELISTSDTYIHNIYFQYIPTNLTQKNVYTLVPAWIIQPSINDTSSGEVIETYLDVIAVNAISGDIIR